MLLLCCKAALKAKGLKDDITVLVVDLVPTEEHKLPPPLAKDGSGHIQAESMQLPSIHVNFPLQDGDTGTYERLFWSVLDLVNALTLPILSSLISATHVV